MTSGVPSFWLLEFLSRSGLLRANAARGDLGKEIVFASNGFSEHPAKHGNLADVSECVGDGSLKQLFGAETKRFAGSESPIEGFEPSKEAGDFFVAGQRVRLVESVLAIGKLDSPIQQISDMRQNLGRRSAAWHRPETCEFRIHITDRFPAAVGERS